MVMDNLQSLRYSLPELTLFVAALIVVLVDISLKSQRRFLNPLLTLLSLILAGYFSLRGGAADAGLFQGMLATDSFAQFFRLLLILAGFLVVVGSLDSDELSTVHTGEFFVLLLVVTAGMILMTNSTNLAMLYLSLELVSLTSYIMVGYLRTDRLSNEAALKYILFGAVSTGAMLYGFSLLYGMTGTLNLYAIRDTFMSQGVSSFNQYTLLLVVLLIMAGFGFKTAAVPFHFWCPDVYAGAPTPVTAFLSVAPKAAGFGILVRFFFSGMSQATGTQWNIMHGLNWPVILVGISVLTMTLGNIAALTQNNLKRMLAYSSIAHAGYIMMGAVVLTEVGLRSMLVYLFVYLFMNLGAFLVVTVIYNSDKTFEIDDYAGLLRRSPFLAVAMSIFLLSLIGIPPFSGFLGKLYVFGAVIDRGIIWLAVVGSLNAAVAAYYYMKVMKAMILDEGDNSLPPLKISPINLSLLVALLLPNILLVVFWNSIDRWVTASVKLFNNSL
jgi:NADH-quinone oxidoreductase subunit N